ncbi:hypothetical protein JD844_005793 [Phrynosoma platyrhinos]|uniref:Protein YIF1 n=1 Tax=Phrynosoma platyrhinos TaxID=52577 RepID=A0ABQ7TQ09_PHRPL|nr:hypothetical protein JD844_005793 [Phrynosoma platyrhinos]
MTYYRLGNHLNLFPPLAFIVVQKTVAPGCTYPRDVMRGGVASDWPAAGRRALIGRRGQPGPCLLKESGPGCSFAAAMNVAGGAGGVAGRMPTKRRLPAAASASDPHRLFEDTSAAAAGRSPGVGPSGGGSSSEGIFLALCLRAAHIYLLLFPPPPQIDRFIPVTKLKYYFAVDTVYVGKKLGLLLFPFLHQGSADVSDSFWQDWQVQYQQDTPVAPRFDVNAPDLYIPVMAFITYILVAGLALGTQNRFSPDLLGLQASSALAWLIVEVLAILLSLYLVTVNTDLSTIDLVAFSGYKYVGMIVGLLAGLLFGKTGYYLLLSWCCVTIVVFMIRTLRLKILSEAAAEGVLVRGAKNQLRMYLTMAVAGLQPLLMYWLTFHLVH